MWDSIYRVIKNMTKRQEDLPLVQGDILLDPKESAEMLASTFYPEDREELDNEEHKRIRSLANRINERSHNEKNDPPFTMEELRYAVNSFNPKKAPGSDEFTADICRNAIQGAPET